MSPKHHCDELLEWWGGSPWGWQRPPDAILPIGASVDDTAFNLVSMKISAEKERIRDESELLTDLNSSFISCEFFTSRQGFECFEGWVGMGGLGGVAHHGLNQMITIWFF